MTEVKIISSNEPWSEYCLEDGTVLRAKTVLIQVQSTGHMDEQGSPLYSLKTQVVSGVVSHGPAMKRKTQ